MATVRFWIQTDDRKAQEGRYPIFLYVSDRGKKEYFATGFFSLPMLLSRSADGKVLERTPQEFDDNKGQGRYRQGSGVKKFEVQRRENGKIVTYSNKDANDILAGMEKDIKAIIKRWDDEKRDWTLNNLRDAYKIKTSASTFRKFAEEVINGYKAEGKYQRASITDDALRSFADYDSQFDKRTFREVDEAYIQGYIKHSQDKGNRAGAIAIRLREIRCIFNRAIEKKVAGAASAYPFGRGKVQLPKPSEDEQQSNRRKFLPIEAMSKLAHAELDNYNEDLARHLFLFSFHAKGINFHDMAELKRANIQEVTTAEGEVQRIITYRRGKTSKRIEVAITRNLQNELDWMEANCPLLDDYLLPIILQEPSKEGRAEYVKQRRKRFNKTLKKIAEKLQLPASQSDLSFYAARHSFAMALFAGGKPMEVISSAMDHADMKTTKAYIAGFTTSKLAELTNIDL